jgi:hypothetical protein
MMTKELKIRTPMKKRDWIVMGVMTHILILLIGVVIGVASTEYRMKRDIRIKAVQENRGEWYISDQFTGKTEFRFKRVIERWEPKKDLKKEKTEKTEKTEAERKKAADMIAAGGI